MSWSTVGRRAGGRVVECPECKGAIVVYKGEKKKCPSCERVFGVRKVAELIRNTETAKRRNVQVAKAYSASVKSSNSYRPS